MAGAGDAGGELDRRATGTPDVLLALVAFCVAFAIRGLTWPSVFTADGIRLVGPDAHYHLRRILWTVENFPNVLTWDPYVSFPNGGEPIWSPFFDQGIAWLAWLVVGPGDPAGVERLAVWVPPVLGAATAAAVFLVGQRFFGRVVGGIAAAFVCLLPSPVHYSQVGLVDHHVAVALISTGLLGALLSWVSPQEPSLRPSIVLGAVMGASLLVWPGSLLHVGLAQTALTLAVLATPESRAAVRATGASVAHGVAFLLVTPFAIGRTWATWGDLSPVVLSSFQPIWLGLPAIGFGACSLAWNAGVARATRLQRTGLLIVAAAAPLLATLAVPSVRAGIADAFEWFFRGESFQAVVAESLPLFSDGRSFTLERAPGLLTPLVFALPFLLAALGATKTRSASHRVVALWCAGLFGATVAQQRFANSLSVPWALTIACSVGLVFRAIPERARVGRGAAAAALGAAAFAVFVPLVRPQLRAWGTAQRAFAGELVHAPERVSHQESLVQAARWLADHSPPTDGWSSPGPAPRYGVLTAWGDGHVTRYVARRPTIQDNFGDDVGSGAFEAAESYFASRDEEAALAIADELRVRYVLVREAGSGHAPKPYDPRSMLVRLDSLRGSADTLRRRNGPVFAPALSRHRLLYESPSRPGEAGRFKLYEIVKGARVEGWTLPGEVVEARLDLEGENGRRFEYRTHGRADAEGRYRIRLPYPTGEFTSQFAATAPYVLEAADVVAPLGLSEEAVRDGRRVEGPTLVP